MKKFLKRLLKRLLVLMLILLIPGAAAGGYWWAQKSLPVLDGQLSFPGNGLGAPVEVLIDAHGVPAIYARDAEDAYFAAGVLHARDRLWQMELYRRVAMGRLSQVMGDDTIEIDKRFLTLGLREAARAEWERVPPQVKTTLERYAAGVNAVIAQLQTQHRLRPLEFQILRFMPAQWEPIDSLSIGRLMAWRLAENHHAELVRGALARKYDVETALLLTGRYPANAPAILEGSLRTSLADPAIHLEAPGAAVPPMTHAVPERLAAKLPAGLEWLSATARRGNSNSWVLAARRTRSGNPMLANDPHLQIEFPSVWYEMHLVAADVDVVGVTIPGVPMVAIGHNQRIAWGITNTGADVQDLALERIDVSGKRAFYRGEWVPVDVVQSEIPVRGRAQALPFEIWKTRNGTILSDVELDFETVPTWLAPNDRVSGERRAYSMRWDVTGNLATAFHAMNRATDWASFTAAVTAFSVPSSNLVYADVDGNIGYAMSGRLPVRGGGDGRMAVDGGTGVAWNGSVDATALPRLLNPESGFITSSNNLVDRSFQSLITNDWAAPFRATRLRQLLSKAEGVDLDAMAVMQNDRHSAAADVLLANIDSAITLGRSREEARQWADRLAELKNWDRKVDNRPIVAYFQAFEDAVWRRTFVDEMEEPLFNKFYEWAGAEKYAGIYSLIDDPNNKWWDDILTVEKTESRDDVFLTAAEDAEIYLQNEYGGESSRDWSRIHGARFPHVIGNVAFPLRWLFSRGPVPIDGDGTTVMRTSYDRLKRFEVWEYPSWRQLFEIGNWDESRVVLPAGQSGHPFSPFYFDQNELWRSGQYRRQPFTRNAVSAAAQHRLLLIP
ncbi:MAG TPA: penicillin acylase family protein [Vicinamibacterales bacterium]|nr:penicillin acylase family protein [Vicinamibacterales bacterium]